MMEPKSIRNEADTIHQRAIMQSTPQAACASRTTPWVGRILSALPVLLLTFSATMKFLKPAPIVQGFAHLGYPESLIPLRS
jgi:DoxX-like family